MTQINLFENYCTIALQTSEGEVIMVMPHYTEWLVAAHQAWQLSEMIGEQAVVAFIYGQKQLRLINDLEITYKFFLDQCEKMTKQTEYPDDIPF